MCKQRLQKHCQPEKVSALQNIQSHDRSDNGNISGKYSWVEDDIIVGHPSPAVDTNGHDTIARIGCEQERSSTAFGPATENVDTSYKGLLSSSLSSEESNFGVQQHSKNTQAPSTVEEFVPDWNLTFENLLHEK